MWVSFFVFFIQGLAVHPATQAASVSQVPGVQAYTTMPSSMLYCGPLDTMVFPPGYSVQ